MARIIDPDDLVVSSSSGNLGVDGNIWLDTSAKTFELDPFGSLVAKDGVTGNALWAKFVDLWATGTTYKPFPFPMNILDARSGQYEFGVDPQGTYNGWKPANDATRQMIRDAGWSEYSSAGVLNRQYVGIVALASGFASGAQFYYQRASGGTAYDFTFDDAPNEGVQVYGDASNGNFDNRTYFKIFLREYNYTYDDAVLGDVGETGTGPYKISLPVSVGSDLKITAVDGSMGSGVYANIDIEYFGSDQTGYDIGSYPFRVVIDNTTANATLEQIYTKVQYLLRQNSDINTGGTAGTKTGKIQDELLRFVGETLVTSQSVYIDDVLSADSNRVEFYDDTNTLRTNLYTAAGTMSFNSVLVGSGSSYRLMFTAPPGAGNDYGESGAITVNNAAGTPITGTISSASIAFDYDYDGNTQGGFSGGTERPVTLIGIRPGYGKFAVATGTLTRSKTIALSLVAEADRVYA
jgi:hypothetical protein